MAKTARPDVALNADPNRRAFGLAGAAGRPVSPGPELATPVRLDVFGKQMLIERSAGAWRTYLLGADGKRSLVDVVVPESMTESELVRYFDDLYHESATPRRPAVVRLS